MRSAEQRTHDRAIEPTALSGQAGASQWQDRSVGRANLKDATLASLAAGGYGAGSDLLVANAIENALGGNLILADRGDRNCLLLEGT